MNIPGPPHSLRQEVVELHRHRASRSREIRVPEVLHPVFFRGTATFIAAAGTIMFAASAAPVFGAGTLVPLAGLPVIAGLPWLVLGASLRWASGIPLPGIADICLLAMVAGEAVLALMAAVNYTFAPALSSSTSGIFLNLTAVLVADFLMGAILASRLKPHGTPYWKTWALWALVLNGIAAILTVVFLQP